ncbi:MAG: hypothetical protein ACREFU_02810 [Acetobacteraceae bacterium]
MKFAEDGYGYKARFGLVYMASSVVMEAEMYAMAASGISIHTSRVRLPRVTVAGIDQMMRSPELEAAVRPVTLVTPCTPDIVDQRNAAWRASIAQPPIRP